MADFRVDFDVKLILILKIVCARVQGAVAVSRGWRVAKTLSC